MGDGVITPEMPKPVAETSTSQVPAEADIDAATTGLAQAIEDIGQSQGAQKALENLADTGAGEISGDRMADFLGETVNKPDPSNTPEITQEGTGEISPSTKAEALGESKPSVEIKPEELAKNPDLEIKPKDLPPDLEITNEELQGDPPLEIKSEEVGNEDPTLDSQVEIADPNKTAEANSEAVDVTQKVEELTQKVQEMNEEMKKIQEMNEQLKKIQETQNTLKEQAVNMITEIPDLESLLKSIMEKATPEEKKKLGILMALLLMLINLATTGIGIRGTVDKEIPPATSNKPKP